MRRFVMACLGLLAALVLILLPGHALAHTLGLDIHQSSTVGPTVAADVGVKWVRVDLSWDLAQPNSAATDWSALDPIVDTATAKGLKVLAVLAHTPAWASSGDLNLLTRQNDVPQVGAYAAYVALAVAHFKNRVTAYELWNEPNNPSYFEGSEKQYFDLILVPGANAVHTACPTCLVLNGGLSSAPAATPSAAHDVWLDTIFKQAPGTIDVVAGHIYAGFPEDNPSIGVSSDSFLNALEMHRTTTTAGVTVSGPRSFVEVMVANGWTKPFWLTGTGAAAAPANTAALTAQTAYYRHVLEKAALREWWAYSFFDDAFDEMGGTSTFGITTAAGGVTYTKKPVFDFLQLATTGKHFGGNTPECGDGIDNDEDGRVDFPSDSDCTSLTGVSEGPYTPTDFSIASTDLGAANGPDGGLTGAIPVSGGATSTTQGAGCRCTFGAADSSLPSSAPLALLAALCVLLVARRTRRA